MDTTQVRPDKGRDEHQQPQRPRGNRTIRFGAIVIAAIVGAIAVMIALLAVGPKDQVAPSAAESTVGRPDPSPSVTFPPDEAFLLNFKDGLPPEGANPSAPISGDIVTSFGPVHPDDPWSAAYLYDDGRLIWAASLGSSSDSATSWIEQRLTRKGVDLLRSATTLNTRILPPEAWQDRELRLYVPSKYVVVATYDYLFGEASRGPGHPPVKHELPARVQDFLRRGDRIVGSGLEVTTDEARMLADILSRSGFEQATRGLGVSKFTSDTLGIDFRRYTIVIELHPVLPDGRVPSFDARGE